MNSDLTDERRMLQESLRRTLERNAGSESCALWQVLADMGAGAALLSEAAGGMGGTGADIALVAEEIGRAGAVVPMIDSVLLGAGVLAAAGGHEALYESLLSA